MDMGEKEGVGATKLNRRACFMITISYPAFVVIVHPSKLFLKSNIYSILVFGISIILPIIRASIYAGLMRIYLVKG